MIRESLEVADIFRKHGQAYRAANKMPLVHIRTMRSIEKCRTAELGGHIDECDCCGRIRISYNSCRNRHCPKCQFLKKEKWVVYSKPPFKDTETLIDYLGRYTHRIAIGNHRILKMEDDQVFFFWRDYADGNKKKIMKLEACEFIRRFLLHVLPEKFVKIRYYGLLEQKKRRDVFSMPQASCRFQ